MSKTLSQTVTSINYPERLSHYLQVVNSWLWNNISLEALIALPAILLALLVPLAIFMIDKKSTGFTWDKAVILTKVLDAKLLFVSLIIMAISPIFWKISHLRIVIVVLVVAALVLLIRTIIASYRWLIVSEPEKGTFQENYRTQKRMEYLRTLDDAQKSVIWSLTWSADRNSRALIDDRQLIKIFVENLNGLGDKQKSGPGILRDFMANLKEIDLSDPIIHEELVGLSMQWASSLANPKKKDKSMLHFQMTARRLYFEILKHDLNDLFGSYLLYEHSRKYLKDHNLDEAYFLRYFSVEFFSAIDNIRDTEQIWAEFPKEWLITIENLDNDTAKPLALVWLNAYMRWIGGRRVLVSTSDDSRYEYDDKADDVTRRLLPGIDPLVWSDLIALHWSAYGSHEGETSEHAQIRGFIERDKRFGLIGRAYGFWEDDGQGSVEKRYREHLDKEVKETFDFATRTTVFPLLLNQDSFARLMSEFDNFDYDEGSAEHRKLQRLKRIFEMVKAAQEEAIKNQGQKKIASGTKGKR